MRHLTNDERDALSEAVFHLRLDAALGDVAKDANTFSRGVLALIRFCKSLGVAFDREDMSLLVDWEPKE